MCGCVLVRETKRSGRGWVCWTDGLRRRPRSRSCAVVVAATAPTGIGEPPTRPIVGTTWWLCVVFVGVPACPRSLTHSRRRRARVWILCWNSSNILWRPRIGQPWRSWLLWGLQGFWQAVEAVNLMWGCHASPAKFIFSIAGRRRQGASLTAVT